jgi:hypothetical protein
MQEAIIFTERKDNETEFALYRYGFTYHTGLSVRIPVWRSTPVLKIKRDYYSGRLIVSDSATPDR